MKEKKLIIGSTAIIAVIILIIAFVSINKGPAKEEETSPVKGTNANGEVTTNYFDNIDVYEGDKELITDADGNVIANKSEDISGEVVTDENGNQVVNIDMSGEATEKASASDGKGKDNKNDDGDVVDDFVVIEEDDIQSPTDSNGETISEEYPGQADGWSPIVSPDELNGN